MSKKIEPATHEKMAQRVTPAEKKSSAETKDGVRETIESVVIALVLAFMFRTFEAEAFVIPTGSMAPTLMGQHKDLDCSNCGFPYRVSASDEVPGEDETFETSDALNRALEQRRVMSCVCPNCRYRMEFGTGDDPPSPPKSFKGDRILVAKFPYELSDPDRWDVAVFKYPETAKQNYIKRIVGLPNETVIIIRGDIYTTPFPEAEPLPDPVIQRKPPAKVQAMQQVVHDNNYALPAEPARWGAREGSSAEIVNEGRAFRLSEATGGIQWLQYEHRVMSPGDWDRLKDGEITPEMLRGAVKPQLVTDFYGYNGGQQKHHSVDPDIFGLHWVGDLSVDCLAKIESDSGAVLLALVEGGRIFTCRIDVATGDVKLSVSGPNAPSWTAQTAIRGAGEYRLQFANTDDQLLLWVNGKSIPFRATYDPLKNLRPTVEDLAPARLGADGADVTFSNLRVLRDVYYIADKARPDHARGPIREENSYRSAGFFSNPAAWDVFDDPAAVEFPLGPDQFFMLGDNSPRSKDGRLWTAEDELGHAEYYVKRDLLIGKALYVYWPHALNHLPGRKDIWFPFFPNFGRMALVR